MDDPVLSGIVSGTEGPDPMAGREVQRMNVAAGKAVGDLVRTTLGPNGMDKLLIDDKGMGIVTNNGATILKEAVNHPIGGLVADVARSQERIIGDGTTTAAVVAGELIGRAESLLDDGIHPATIVKGYNAASTFVREELQELGIDVDPNDEDCLLSIVRTTMNGKGVGMAGGMLAEQVVEAAGIIREGGGLDENDLQVVKVTGGSLADTHLLRGVVVRKDRAHPGMPYMVRDATVAVVDGDLDVDTIKTESRISFKEPGDIDKSTERTRTERVEIIDKLTDMGVEVLVCGGAINQDFRGLLTDAGVYAIHRLDPDELPIVARATGASIVNDLRTATHEDLGGAGLVSEKEIGGELRTSFEDVTEADVVTLILRGTSMNLLDEHHRALEDAIASLKPALEEGQVVPGGGAIEMELVLRLREKATSSGNREGLAINAVADALEVIPRTIAENAGINPIDGTIALRKAHAEGAQYAGLDAETGDVIDMIETGVIESLAMKRAAFTHASEAAISLLRIDGLLPSRTNLEEKEYEGPM